MQTSVFIVKPCGTNMHAICWLDTLRSQNLWSTLATLIAQISTVGGCMFVGDQDSVPVTLCFGGGDFDASLTCLPSSASSSA
eukprot:m.779025 g.779025  ORF g.779025 m.779025 type:complete len:82 (-) comp23276_c1_seq5:3648-3893(-)